MASSVGCAEHTASEHQSGLVRTPKARALLDELIKGINSNQVDDHQKSWSDVLEAYTGMALTVPSDRLPAVVGLGSELSRLTGKVFEMSVGVWRKHMVQELAWVTCHDVHGGPCMVARSTDIPSWSWASVYQQIHFPMKPADEGYVELVRVLSVEPPKVRIRGRMATIDLCKTQSIASSTGERSIGARLDPRTFELVQGTAKQEARGMAVLDTLADVQTTALGPVPCLQWITHATRTLPANGRSQRPGAVTGCLILAPISKKRKLYRRIGWLEVESIDFLDEQEKTITLI